MESKTATKFQSINDFAETDERAQKKLEEKLSGNELESVLSPAYFLYNVNAFFVGF